VPFVGRQAELQALMESFAVARSGRPVLVWLSGAAGMGKSSLLDAFASELRRHDPPVLLLSGRCYEQESVPHKALDTIIDTLARHLERVPLAELASLADDDLAALTQLFPALLRVKHIAERSRTLSADPREVRRRGHRALGEVLHGLAEERPLVLLIDDLHWGDLDSAQVLVSLLTSPRVPKLLLVVAHRDEAEGACTRMLADQQSGFSDAVECCEITLRGLAGDDARSITQALLGRVSDDAGVAAAICGEAKGNPLLLCELSRHALAQSTDARLSTGASALSLADVVRARMARLDPSARSLFQLFCVAGHPLAQHVALAVRMPDLVSSPGDFSALRALRHEGL
jgi:predicted ATPase